ncbi:MAG: carbon-nitrogen hydrolase family protein [Candidatus Geothermarchaeales archaeon]
MKRYVDVACIQCGPCTTDKDANLKEAMKLLDEASKKEPSFIIFSELFSTPYWSTSPYNDGYFEWAEPIPGPTTKLLGEKAKQHGCNVIAPFFEKGKLEGEYYNSAVVIGSDGNIVRGTLPDGEVVTCYRKNHLPFIPAVNLDEKPYFKPGPGLPTFKVDEVTFGILICYDRLFSEAWRTLAMGGSEIVFVPSCISTWWGEMEEKYTPVMRSMAIMNQLYVVGCNKGGKEVLNGVESSFFGKSSVYDPFGELLAQAPENQGPAVITATLDLRSVSKARRGIPIYMDRRPEIYRG